MEIKQSMFNFFTAGFCLGLMLVHFINGNLGWGIIDLILGGVMFFRSIT